MLNGRAVYPLPAKLKRGTRTGGAAECRRAGPGAATASATHVTRGSSVDSALTQPGARLASASGVTGGTEGTSVPSTTVGCIRAGAATARALRGFAQGP
jgi:hypothetical protein